MLASRVFLPWLLIASAAFAFPPQYQQEINLPGYDVNDDDVTEERNPLEDLVYRTVMQQLLGNIRNKPRKGLLLPNNMNNNNGPSPSEYKAQKPDKVLQELQALESAVTESKQQQNGRWLDQIQDVSNLLPSNFHNSSEYNTKFGDMDVNVKQDIDKSTKGNSESLWLSEVVKATSDHRGPSFACSIINPCMGDRYCFETTEMSECRTCHVIGSRCVDDAQCCVPEGSQSYCVYGVCKRDVSRGSPGTFCDSIDDCDEGLCCTQDRDLRRRVCKLFAKIGQRCSQALQLFDDIIMIDENDVYCPCEAGLTCEEGSDLLQTSSVQQNRFCRVSAEKGPRDPIEVGHDTILTPSGKQKAGQTDTSRHTRLESEADQRYDEVLPLVHKDSKKALDFRAEGPMM